MRMMKKKLMWLVWLLVSPAVTPAQTAAQIVGRALTARGGIVKILAVKSQRVTGTISFGEDVGPFVVELERPMKMHMKFTLQDQVMIRIYDGKSAGWANNPFAGKVNVEDMAEDELKNISDESDSDGPFVDAKQKGNHYELAGKDKVGDQDVWRIKLTTKNGDVRYYSFDAKTYLLLRWEGERRYKGQVIPTQSFFHDYRDVEGLKFAFKIDSGTSLSTIAQKLVIDKIELNIPIDDAEFAKPVAPAAAPEAVPPTVVPPATTPPASTPPGSTPPGSTPPPGSGF
jgi:hypothetical protein